MTIHIDIARSTATLAEVIDLVSKGEFVVVDREGRPLGELVLQPPLDPSLAAIKAKHPFFGALAHLGPIPDGDSANTFDG